jgi:undecaprenyl-diphosphatase
MPAGMAAPFAWGVLSSAVSGFLVIAFLLSYLRRHDFVVFLIYRLAAAAFILIIIATGVRSGTV